MPCRTLSSRRSHTYWAAGNVDRMNSSPASRPDGARPDDRSRSKSFHIILEPSMPFGVVAFSRTAWT
jgi:hypothetical protein